LGRLLDVPDPGDPERESKVSRDLNPVGKHVYLTGFMGAGKSTVGRALAERLDWPFVDLDDSIEAEQGMTIAEIFASRGEVWFRQLESAALRSLDDSVAAVVATGGGVLSVPENREWMRAHGLAVWLDVSFELVTERLAATDQETRPLFENESRARELFAKRQSQYGDSDLRIEVLSSHSAAELAAMIQNILIEEECVT
jgi:shikimate kinase